MNNIHKLFFFNVNMQLIYPSCCYAVVLPQLRVFKKVVQFPIAYSLL